MMKQIQVGANGHAQAFETYSWDGGKSWCSTNGSGNRAMMAFFRRKKMALNFKFSEQELRWIDSIENDVDSVLAGHKERFMRRRGLAERKKVEQARTAVSVVDEPAVGKSSARLLWSAKELCWKEAVTSEKRLEAWRLYVEHGLSVYEIAERMQVHQTTVSRWIVRMKSRDNDGDRRFAMQPKNTQLSVPVDSAEREVVLKAARAEGVSICEFIRRSCRERAKRILESDGSLATAAAEGERRT